MTRTYFSRVAGGIGFIMLLLAFFYVSTKFVEESEMFSAIDRECKEEHPILKDADISVSWFARKNWSCGCQNVRAEYLDLKSTETPEELKSREFFEPSRLRDGHPDTLSPKSRTEHVWKLVSDHPGCFEPWQRKYQGEVSIRFTAVQDLLRRRVAKLRLPSEYVAQEGYEWRLAEFERFAERAIAAAHVNAGQSMNVWLDTGSSELLVPYQLSIDYTRAEAAIIHGQWWDQMHGIELIEKMSQKWSGYLTIQAHFNFEMKEKIDRLRQFGMMRVCAARIVLSRLDGELKFCDDFNTSVAKAVVDSSLNETFDPKDWWWEESFHPCRMVKYEKFWVLDRRAVQSSPDEYLALVQRHLTLVLQSPQHHNAFAFLAYKYEKMLAMDALVSKVGWFAFDELLNRNEFGIAKSLARVLATDPDTMIRLAEDQEVSELQKRGMYSISTVNGETIKTYSLGQSIGLGEDLY